MVAAWVICAETDEEAQRLAASSRMTLTLLRQGRLIPVPPVEKALRFLEQQGAPNDRRGGAGGAGSSGRRRRCARGSRSSPASTAPRRSMLVTITHDHAARRRSYELVADVFADVLQERRQGAEDRALHALADAGGGPPGG